MKIFVWIMTGITSALFLVSAIPKFTLPGWVSRFAAWGYPEWFLYVIAVLEAAAAIALLIPRLAPYAAGGLVVIMLGAMYTHLTHGEGILWNVGYVVALGIIGWYRWQQRDRTAATGA